MAHTCISLKSYSQTSTRIIASYEEYNTTSFWVARHSATLPQLGFVGEPVAMAENDLTILTSKFKIIDEDDDEIIKVE